MKKQTTKKVEKELYDVMFVDIETVANESAIKLIDDPKPAKNLVDPVKIAADIAAKKQDIIDHAPLDSDYGRIAAIGYAIGRNGEIVTNLVSKKNSEKAVLSDFWLQYAIVHGRSAGYNIMSFDIPFIMKRSFDLGVRPSILPHLSKYRSDPTVDLYMLLCNWDYTKGHKFKFICKRYGIKVEAEGVDGSQVKDMSPEELKLYLHSDVAATRELYYRMQGFYF